MTCRTKILYHLYRTVKTIAKRFFLHYIFRTMPINRTLNLNLASGRKRNTLQKAEGVLQNPDAYYIAYFSVGIKPYSYFQGCENWNVHIIC